MSTPDVSAREREESRVSRRLRWTAGLGLIVPLFLAWEGIAALAVGVSFLMLPHNVVNSPTVSALYHWVSPTAWGVIFMLLGLVCWSAVIWPKVLWRHAMFFLFEVQITWAIGLAVPVVIALFKGTHPDVNAIASIAWTNLVGTTVIVILHAHRFNNGRR